MSSSEGSRSFRFIAVFTLCGAVAVGFAWSKPLQAYKDSRAASYASQADHERNTLRAIGQYRLALALDPGNAGYRLKLSSLYSNSGDFVQAASLLGDSDEERLEKGRLQLKLGKPDKALKALEPLSSTKAKIYKSQALLEEGRGDDAVSAVEDETTDEEAMVQLGIAYAVTEQVETADGLSHQVQKPENSKKLRSAQAGGTALAQVLYKEGMYQTALRVLKNTKEESSARYLLLAHLQLSKQKLTDSDLLSAQDTLKKGIKVDPSNIALHELLRDVYTKLEQSDSADNEKDIIDQLKTGKI